MLSAGTHETSAIIGLPNGRKCFRFFYKKNVSWFLVTEKIFLISCKSVNSVLNNEDPFVYFGVLFRMHEHETWQ